MKNADTIFKHAGVICIPVYVLFTFISHLYSPTFSPMTNWLSDFGDPLKNPSGALFYNLGCIVVAALLTVFYVGLHRWYKHRRIKRKYYICFVCAQISGIVGAVCLVLASVFPLGTETQLHSMFSRLNMIGMDCFLSFTALAFLMNLNTKRWVGVFGYLASIFNIVTTNAFSSLYAAEWVYFLLFMVYVVVLTLEYDRIVDLDRPSQQRSVVGAANAR